MVVGGHDSVELSIRIQVSGLIADSSHSGLTKLLQSTLIWVNTAMISYLSLRPNMLSILSLLDSKALFCLPLSLLYIFIYRVLEPP